jgi:hypothetical protein
MSAAAARDALRAAAHFSLEPASVLSHLDRKERVDRLFARAFTRGLQSVPLAERRSALAPITGHVAESVIASELVEYGWTPVWQFIGPGGHGVDLLMLDPSVERVLALEVKGTLSPTRWPRLRGREVEQMSRAWVDKADNPGMEDWTLDSADVYGGIAFVGFSYRAFKVVFSPDFEAWQPVQGADQLEDTTWLRG